MSSALRLPQDATVHGGDSLGGLVLVVVVDTGVPAVDMLVDVLHIEPDLIVELQFAAALQRNTWTDSESRAYLQDSLNITS